MCIPKQDEKVKSNRKVFAVKAGFAKMKQFLERMKNEDDWVLFFDDEGFTRRSIPS